MDVPQIKDRDHLEAWLRTRSRDECVAVAHRAAMRVAPLWIGEVDKWSHKGDPINVLFFWPLLTGGVSAISPKAQVRDSANVAARATNFDSSASTSALASPVARAAARAAVFAAKTTEFAMPYPAHEAGNTARAAAYAASLSDDEAVGWDAIWGDLGAVSSGVDLLIQPLWNRAENPFADNWNRARADLVSRGPNWDFWVRWYEAALRGGPMDWELQEEIALLPSDVWEDDVAGLAEKIREIEIDFAAAATPNAEIIELNPETGKFRSAPDSRLPADHLADVQQKIVDAAETFESNEVTDNRYTASRDDIAYLRRRTGRDQNKPRALYDLSRSVIRRTEARVRDGSLPPDDPLVTDFIQQLNEVCIDIINFDEKVKEVVIGRSLMRPVNMDPAMSASISLVANTLAEVTEGELVEDIPDDARLINDPNANPDARQTATYREVFRLASLWKLFKSLDAKGKVLTIFVGIAGFSAGAVAIADFLIMVAKVVGYLFGLIF